MNRYRLLDLKSTGFALMLAGILTMNFSIKLIITSLIITLIGFIMILIAEPYNKKNLLKEILKKRPNFEKKELMKEEHMFLEKLLYDIEKKEYEKKYLNRRKNAQYKK